MAASLVALLLVSLAVTSSNALDKQIKLEDIERDNLQTEIVRRPQHQSASPQQEQLSQLRQQQLHLQQQQQLHRQQQIAYQQQLLQQRYSAPQEQHQPLTYHQQFQQQLQQHREQALLRERERERERPEQNQPQQSLQQYSPATSQLLQDVATGSHVMYLIMPGGNIAAIPIAHPNQIQALFGPVKPHYSPAFSNGPVGVPTQVVQAYFQPQVPVPIHSHPHQPSTPEVAPEQPARTQLQYVLPSQQHRITFSQQSPQPQYSQPGPQPVVYRDSGAQPETEFQFTPQSQKSIFSPGIKSTVAPQLKGATGFSTQTGSSYANFRQYAG